MIKRHIAHMLPGVMMLLLVSNSVFAESIEVTFAYIGQADPNPLLGVQQGLDEANLQGQFLNQRYKLDIISNENMSKNDYSKYIAILTSVDSDTFTKLTESLPDMPIFNLSLKDDNLRTSCIRNALHIIPSNSMISDAVKQWKMKKAESDANAYAWHPDFVKFAARDLNKRFKKSANVEMNDYSWAGWAAVKMTSDTVARTNITDPAKLLTYLRTELIFDGQKGSDMNFRETGQLRQPMLLVENNNIVAEAPVRGIAKPPTLDSLGTFNCQK